MKGYCRCACQSARTQRWGGIHVSGCQLQGCPISVMTPVLSGVYVKFFSKLILSEKQRNLKTESQVLGYQEKASSQQKKRPAHRIRRGQHSGSRSKGLSHVYSTAGPDWTFVYSLIIVLYFQFSCISISIPACWSFIHRRFYSILINLSFQRRSKLTSLLWMDCHFNFSITYPFRHLRLTSAHPHSIIITVFVCPTHRPCRSNSRPSFVCGTSFHTSLASPCRLCSPLNPITLTSVLFTPFLFTEISNYSLHLLFIQPSLAFPLAYF